MRNRCKHPLVWYEDNANEVKLNLNDSVTFIFDEPPIDSESVASSTTISEEDYKKAQADPNFLV